MSTSTCPNGHPSEASDYCDTCGAPIGEAAQAPSSANTPTASPRAPDLAAANAAAPGAPTNQPCPNCQLVNTADALFCEGCGYDFTTGTMPRESSPANALSLDTPPVQAAAADPVPPSTAPAIEVEWVAEVWVDPDWYAEQRGDEPCPSPGLPVVVPLATQSLLIGRRSKSRNIHPEIECSADVGVSRRQAQLTTDGQRWWVEDLQSANGTYVAAASGALPTDPLPPGQRRELAQDDHIYVGAWTCIVIRRATPEEKAGQA